MTFYRWRIFDAHGEVILRGEPVEHSTALKARNAAKRVAESLGAFGHVQSKRIEMDSNGANVLTKGEPWRFVGGAARTASGAWTWSYPE